MAAVSFAVLVLFAVGGVFACSCLMPGTPSEEFGKYDYIFSGKVASIGYPIDAVGEEAYSLDIVFNVSIVWQGLLGSEVHIRTAKDSAACGYPFNEGEEYLVYASGNESKKSANICSRTKLLSEANEDLEYLANQTCTSVKECQDRYNSCNYFCQGVCTEFFPIECDLNDPTCKIYNYIYPNCSQGKICAQEGEMYSKVYSEYPASCCEGLTEWASGFDSRIAVNGTCQE